MSDKTIKILVYAHLDRDNMYEKGLEVGLDETASHYLSHYHEVTLQLTINKDTGEVIKTELP